jgi:hypothetical protein
VVISPELLGSVPPEELAGARVVVLDGAREVMGQVGAALQAHPGTTVVRLISHGEPGNLLLAGQRISPYTLQLHSHALAGWRQHLAPGAEILLYGCSVAATPEGRSFVDGLAALTGAAVAASVTPTGSAALGGDLTLGYATGPIKAQTERFSQAWDQSGLILAVPVFSSSAAAAFTTALAGSFSAAASGSPTYSIAQKTYFASDFSDIPRDWSQWGNASLSGGSSVLNPSANNQKGALILPKLGASSPGSFTASFDYLRGTTPASGDGTSFNYGIVSTTNGSATSMTTGLAVAFIDSASSPRIDVRWNNSVIGSATIPISSTAKPVEIKLDGANILTVSYDSKTALRINLAGKVNAADRTDYQFALGATTSASTNTSHGIDNLRIVSNGELPAGLALNSATGVISGTPSSANNAGVQVFDLVASNAEGATRQAFTLGLASGAPVFTSAATNPMLPGVAETYTVAATGPAGATTYGVGKTLITTTLALADTLPASAYLGGNAKFNGGILELTQNSASQAGLVQFLGDGAQNTSSFSASFSYKVGGGSTTLGGMGIAFTYGAPGDNTKGLKVTFTEINTVGTLTNAKLYVGLTYGHLEKLQDRLIAIEFKVY